MMRDRETEAHLDLLTMRDEDAYRERLRQEAAAIEACEARENERFRKASNNNTRNPFE